ncbi:MAG: hypothetical protein ACRECO_00205 [Xanthobacteraceae bacterium]
MRKLVIGIIAAGTLIAAVPAGAQVSIDVPGVDVRVGSDRHYYRHYGSDRERRVIRRDRDCRTVTVRERRPNGNVVVRKRTRC